MLSTIVISALLTITSAQIPAFGRCPSVQVVPNFDATRVSEIIMKQDIKIILKIFIPKFLFLVLGQMVRTDKISNHFPTLRQMYNRRLRTQTRWKCDSSKQTNQHTVSIT
jgi:hypothetical protein